MNLFEFINSTDDALTFILEPDAIEIYLQPKDKVNLVWSSPKDLRDFYQQGSSLFGISYFERSIVVYHNYYNEITLNILFNDTFYYTT